MIKIIKLKSKNLFLILATLTCIGLPLSVFSQDNTMAEQDVMYSVPKVAMLDIEGGAISLEFTSPTEAGRRMQKTTDNTLWLNYSSTTSSGHTNVIRANINAEEPGVNIRVEADVYSGSGDGDLGTPTGLRILTTTNKNIIDDIGTCFTGNGINTGHNLTYSLSIEDYSLIKYTTTKTVTVTYTITNN